MKQFFMSEIKTSDGLLHQGIYTEPVKKGTRAILWMHGLSAAFYNDYQLYEVIADACNAEGWGFAIFNNRGHDLIAGIRKYDGTQPNGYSYYPGGAGNEVFEECIFDINAGIDFLIQKGFTEIVLVGHSTGANKVCYYAATQQNPRVAGIILAGPLCDRLGTKTTDRQMREMKQKIKDGKGDELLFGYHFFPITPKRFVSLFEPRTAEDVFDYGDARPTMTVFSKIQLPLLVLIGGADEYADRPVEQIQSVFDAHAKSSQYKSIIIPDALHKFHGKERNVANALVSWIKDV